MHDWLLVEVKYAWADKECLLMFINRHSEVKEIYAKGVEYIVIPHKEEWGATSSVNEVGISDLVTGLTELTIEMQSGDIITIHAEGFDGLE